MIDCLVAMDVFRFKKGDLEEFSELEELILLEDGKTWKDMTESYVFDKPNPPKDRILRPMIRNKHMDVRFVEDCIGVSCQTFTETRHRDWHCGIDQMVNEAGWEFVLGPFFDCLKDIIVKSLDEGNYEREKGESDSMTIITAWECSNYIDYFEEVDVDWGILGRVDMKSIKTIEKA